jgi:AcrR family transcriptional regulator
MAEMTSRPDLLQAAFDLVAERGLRAFSLAAVATRAGVPLVEVYRELPSRHGMLWALTRRADEVMLAYDQAELAGLPPRDRVFELMMRRFDALAPFRAGLDRLARDAPREPAVVLLGSCRLERSMRWLQDAVGLRSFGVRARLRRAALVAAYTQAFRVWLRDDSADLARTMAELDKGLRRIEAFAGLRERRARPAADEELTRPA